MSSRKFLSFSLCCSVPLSSWYLQQQHWSQWTRGMHQLSSRVMWFVVTFQLYNRFDSGPHSGCGTLVIKLALPYIVKWFPKWGRGQARY